MLDQGRRHHVPGDDQIVFEAVDRFDFGSAEYRQFFSHTRSSAFQYPDWLAAFYRHMAPAHHAAPLVVTGRDGRGELRLLVPLVRLVTPDGLHRIEYAFLGVTDYACPVIADGVSLGPELSQRFRGALGRYRRLTIGPVHRDHLPFWSPLLNAEPAMLDFGAHAVNYGMPYGDWRRSNLGARQAAVLDRKARRLCQPGNPLLEIVRPDEIRAAMITARDWRAGRFRDDPLQTTHGLEFYVDVATNGARSGATRTYRLVCAGAEAAIVFGLIDNDCFRYILLACDYRHFGRHSPGRVALDRVMAAWMEDGGTSFDFTIGDEPFKADFGCSRTPMYEFRL